MSRPIYGEPAHITRFIKPFPLFSHIYNIFIYLVTIKNILFNTHPRTKRSPNISVQFLEDSIEINLDTCRRGQPEMVSSGECSRAAFPAGIWASSADPTTRTAAALSTSPGATAPTRREIRTSPTPSGDRGARAVSRWSETQRRLPRPLPRRRRLEGWRGRRRSWCCARRRMKGRALHLRCELFYFFLSFFFFDEYFRYNCWIRCFWFLIVVKSNQWVKLRSCVLFIFIYLLYFIFI